MRTALRRSKFCLPRFPSGFCSEISVFGAGLLDNLLLCSRQLVGPLCSTLLSRFPDDLCRVSRGSRSCPRLHPCIGVSGHSAPAPASAMSDRNAAAGVGDRPGDDSAGKGNLSPRRPIRRSVYFIVRRVCDGQRAETFLKSRICVILAICQRMPATLRCSAETRSVDQ